MDFRHCNFKAVLLNPLVEFKEKADISASQQLNACTKWRINYPVNHLRKSFYGENNGLKSLTIFAKSFILDVWRVPENAVKVYIENFK